MSHHNQQQQQQQQHQMDEFGRTQTMPKLKPNQVAVVTESPPHPQQILVKAAAEKGSPVVVVEDSSEQPAAGRVNVFEIEARNLCYRTPRSRRHILLDSSCCTTTSSSSSSSSRGRSSSSSSSSSSRQQQSGTSLATRTRSIRRELARIGLLWPASGRRPDVTRPFTRHPMSGSMSLV